MEIFLVLLALVSGFGQTIADLFGSIITPLLSIFMTFMGGA